MKSRRRHRLILVHPRTTRTSQKLTYPLLNQNHNLPKRLQVLSRSTLLKALHRQLLAQNPKSTRNQRRTTKSTMVVKATTRLRLERHPSPRRLRNRRSQRNKIRPLRARKTIGRRRNVKTRERSKSQSSEPRPLLHQTLL